MGATSIPTIASSPRVHSQFLDVSTQFDTLLVIMTGLQDMDGVFKYITDHVIYEDISTIPSCRRGYAKTSWSSRVM